MNFEAISFTLTFYIQTVSHFAENGNSCIQPILVPKTIVWGGGGYATFGGKASKNFTLALFDPNLDSRAIIVLGSRLVCP